MSKPHDSPLIPEHTPSDLAKQTSKGRIYAKRQPQRAFRHGQNLRLDSITTELLFKAQSLDALKVADGLLLSRTVLIRRAVLLYAQQLLKAARMNNNHVLAAEKDEMLAMSTNGRKQTHPLTQST